MTDVRNKIEAPAIVETLRDRPRLAIRRPVYPNAPFAPHTYDKHEFELIDGDWERDVTLPNNVRGAVSARWRAHDLIARAKLFLDFGLLAEAIDVGRRACAQHRLARDCEARAAAIRARLTGEAVKERAAE